MNCNNKQSVFFNFTPTQKRRGKKVAKSLKKHTPKINSALSVMFPDKPLLTAGLGLVVDVGITLIDQALEEVEYEHQKKISNKQVEKTKTKQKKMKLSNNKSKKINSGEDNE